MAILTVLSGCGSSKPAAETPPPASQKTDSAKAETEEPKIQPDYTLDAVGDEAILKEPVQRAIARSKLWSFCFLKMLAKPGATKPVANMSLKFKKSASDAGGVSVVSLEVMLTVSDSKTDKQLYQDSYVEMESNVGVNTKSLAAELLKKMSVGRPLEVLVERAALASMCTTGEEGQKLFAETVKSHDEYINEALLKAFSATKPSPKISGPIFINAYTSKMPGVKALAIQEVPKLKLSGNEALPIYVEHLNSPDPVMQVNAATSLEKIGVDAAEPLAHALAHENGEVRSIALRALMAMGPSAKVVIPILVDMAGRDRDPVERYNSLRVLATMNTDELAIPLAGYVTDCTELTLGWTFEQLCEMGPRAKAAAPTLEHAYKVSDVVTRQNLLKVFMKMGPEQAGNVVNGLCDPDSSVQATAIKMTTQVGPPALPALERLMQDPRVEVRRSAVMAMWKIGRPSAVQLQAALSDTNKAVVEVANSALVDLKLVGVAAQKKNVWEKAPGDKSAVAVKAPPKKPAGEEKASTLPKLLILKDGKRIEALKMIDIGEEYSVKTPDGKFMVVAKKDIERVEE